MTVRKPRSKPSTLRFPLEKTESFSLILSVTHPDPGFDTLHKFVNRKRGIISQQDQAEVHFEFPSDVVSNLLPYLSFKDICKLGRISKALYIARYVCYLIYFGNLDSRGDFSSILLATQRNFNFPYPCCREQRISLQKFSN